METPDRIQDFLPDGFQVGADMVINGAGTIYHYVAWAETPGKVATGDYAGDGVDDRDITGLGFRPEYVLVAERHAIAPVELVRNSLPLLEKASKPIIVNIGSVLGHWAAPQKSEYCASKFALHGFTDALNCELRPKGIDVLLVTPSTTQTEFFDHLPRLARCASR